MNHTQEHSNWHDKVECTPNAYTSICIIDIDLASVFGHSQELLQAFQPNAKQPSAVQPLKLSIQESEFPPQIATKGFHETSKRRTSTHAPHTSIGFDNGRPRDLCRSGLEVPRRNKLQEDKEHFKKVCTIAFSWIFSSRDILTDTLIYNINDTGVIQILSIRLTKL
jgi:hypothetical protein